MPFFSYTRIKSIHRFSNCMSSLNSIYNRKLAQFSACKIVNYIEDDIDNTSFMKQIYEDGVPVILQGLISKWPAISDTEKRWDDLSRLRSRVDGIVVPIEYGGDYMSPKTQFGQVDFSSLIDVFLSGLEKENNNIESLERKHDPNTTHTDKIKQTNVHIYLAQHNLYEIPSIANDVIVPKICNTGKGHLYKANIWFGGVDGTKSPCHYDPFYNILCQVVGTKHIILFHPNQQNNLYPAIGTVQKNTSLVDIMYPDLIKHPLFEHAVGYEAELKPGDALFIPYKWWHYCQSDKLSCSVNFWWL